MSSQSHEVTGANGEPKAAAGADNVPTIDLTAARPGPCGRYFRKSFHARGGMGEVWLSQDNTIGRDIALKVLRHDSESAKARFLAEAQITGQLEHPNIVPVHDFGMDDEGHPYYVMKFVRGRTLKQAIAEYHGVYPKSAAPRELQRVRLLQVFIDLCHAVAYAHSRGMLHRDVKPDNVMLGPYGETLVLDWGIAKVVGHPDHGGISGEGVSGHTNSIRSMPGNASSATSEGTVLGTASYMPPEMAEGQASRTDERSDVYLLGATLYEIVTGRMPRQGSSREEMLELARTVSPPPARRLYRQCPRAVEAIAVKAMAHCQKDRYAGAMELAEDVQRYLAGEPVLACSEPLPARIWRWCRRHRVAVLRSAVAALVLALALLAMRAASNARELRERALARSDLDRFHQMADEAKYYAASTDALTEQAPYFDPGKGQALAEQALALAQRWGPALKKWPLPGDLPGFRADLYGLLLLTAQVRNARGQDPRQTQELLDEAGRLSLHPTQSYYRLRSDCQARLGNASAAATAAGLAAAAHPDANDLFLLGEQHRAGSGEGNGHTPADSLRKALDAYQGVLRIEPNHYWAQFQLGRCCLSLGRDDEAVAALNTCVALRPQEPWGYSARGLALALLGRFNDARQDLDHAISLRPDFKPAFLNRGVCDWLESKSDSAIADLNAALEPSSARGLIEARYYLAQIQLAQHDLPATISDLSNLLAARPQFLPARALRAQAYLLQGKPGQSMEDVDAVAAADKTDTFLGASVNERRGHLLRKWMRSWPEAVALIAAAEAERQLLVAVDGGARSPQLFADLGAVQDRLGRAAEAVKAYSKSLQFAPGNASVLMMRAVAYTRLKRYDDASADFLEVARLDPGDARAHGWLGYVLAVKGGRDAPAREAVEALTAVADDFVIVHHAACIFAERAHGAGAQGAEDLNVTMILLRRAIAIWKTRISGPNEMELIRAEPAFQFPELQQREDFQGLLHRQ
jgi:serine/threonine protein kinase/Flp pilus assembly protein TadD